MYISLDTLIPTGDLKQYMHVYIYIYMCRHILSFQINKHTKYIFIYV